MYAISILILYCAIALAGHDEFTIRESAGDILLTYATTESSYAVLREAYRNTEDAEVRHRIWPALKKNQALILESLLPSWQQLWPDIDYVVGLAPVVPPSDASEEAFAEYRTAFVLYYASRDSLREKYLVQRTNLPDAPGIGGWCVDYRYAGRAWALDLLARTGDIEEVRRLLLTASEHDRESVSNRLPSDDTLPTLKKYHPNLLNKGYVRP